MPNTSFGDNDFQQDKFCLKSKNAISFRLGKFFYFAAMQKPETGVRSLSHSISLQTSLSENPGEMPLSVNSSIVSRPLSVLFSDNIILDLRRTFNTAERFVNDKMEEVCHVS